MTEVSGAETRKAFHHELVDIRQQMFRLAGSVVEAIPRATQVLLDGDMEAAEYLIASDDEVDARSLELEEECIRVVALQAPVAGDLREMVAAFRMIPELERSHDLVVNICKAARRIYGHDLDARLRGLITKLGELAHGEFRTAVEAYTEHDAAKAAALGQMDDLLDEVHRDFVQAIFDAHARGGMDVQVAVQLAMVARFYERLGDHAVNVADKVRYIATGWMPEHAAVARYRFAQGSPAPDA